VEAERRCGFSGTQSALCIHGIVQNASRASRTINRLSLWQKLRWESQKLQGKHYDPFISCRDVERLAAP
jgi:hypothetical protein